MSDQSSQDHQRAKSEPGNEKQLDVKNEIKIRIVCEQII